MRGRGGEEQAMTYHDAGVAMARWEEDALPTSVTTMTLALRSFAQRHGFRPTQDLELALSEAITDAVSNDLAGLKFGRVRVAAAIDAECLSVRIDGQAPPRDGRALLPLGRSLADRFETERPDGVGTSVLMEFVRRRSRSQACRGAGRVRTSWRRR
jgi:anti-sigma regulatory factor (Ser/Thr protein kinase)